MNNNQGRISFPLRFHRLSENGYLFTADGGDFFLSSRSFLNRYVTEELTSNDHDFLLEAGLEASREDDFYFLSHVRRLVMRHAAPASLSYLMLVPTLRCNLSCSYCQVSRAQLNANGFDWTGDILSAALSLMEKLPSDRIKIEFQGGEPLLRVD